jgi:ribosomal protein S27AE
MCNKCGLPFSTQQELATHKKIKHAESPYSFLEGECPVKTPKLLSAESTVETCASCGKWVQRYPSFMGDDDGYWQCEKCGCTSIRSRAGRPYGPKSRRWEWVVEQFNELFLDIAPWDRDTVQSTPPLKELDWESVETWFNANNIYRGFINVEIVEITES